jgi:hypothetical protein
MFFSLLPTIHPEFSEWQQVCSSKLRQPGFVGKRTDIAGFAVKLIARSGDMAGDG